MSKLCKHGNYRSTNGCGMCDKEHQLKPKKQTVAQQLLRTHLAELGISTDVEYRFSQLRRWRFDLYIPERRIGIEIDGGAWNGGHRHGGAVELDHEKSNTAQLLGMSVLRFTNRQVLNGEAKSYLQEWLCPIGVQANA